MGDLTTKLDDLFKQFASPVVAVRKDRVVYCNPAAEVFFSGSVLSKHPNELFRSWPYPAGAAVSETVAERDCLLTVSNLSGTAVVTLSKPVDNAVLKKAVEDKDYTVTDIA